jgi:SNF2 family DNA or RNA helicase
VNDDGKVYVDERAGRHGELQARLRSNFMVRREKYGPNGVGYQLGMMHLPQYEVIQVEETKEVKRALAAERMLDIDPEQLEGVDAECLGQVATVRRLMGLAMAPLAYEYVDMLLDGGEEKIVVFAHHIQVLDYLCAKLAKWGVVRIDGSMGQTKKQKQVDAFRLNPRIQVVIGNMQSMGTGTDGLQEVAHRAVFAEPDWVDGTNQQAVDRLDRGGQKTKVQADFLVAPGSFLERVLGSALRKGQTTHKALDRQLG